MDLTKFLWLLQRRALFFTRADFLGDPYEGHYTEAIADVEEQLVNCMIYADTGRIEETEARRFARQFRAVVTDTKKSLFVNCWHMNDEESSAMWKLYTSHHQSVCVRSNYRLLADLLPDNCKLGCVKYVDYRSYLIDPNNALNYIAHKRSSFEHERELRAVIWVRETEEVDGVTRWKFSGQIVKRDDEAIGVVVPVDITKMIAGVLVSPDSDGLLLEVVQGLCDRYELPVQVVKSGVNAPPAY